jgi:4a-hydroxytetrahydrobiopterin dehydratase
MLPRPVTLCERDPPVVAHPAWRRRGETLVRDLEFRDFDGAMSCARQIAERAVDYGRRPDMMIAAHRLRLLIANPHHAGLTAGELRLLSKVDAVVDQRAGASPS